MLNDGNEVGISCLMPTFGRVSERNGWLYSELLEEAVNSFLLQKHTKSELIILNDTPGQTLDMFENCERVRIINAPERYPSLGDKCNVLIDEAKYEFVTRWDDDDISLPWRLSNCARLLTQCEVLLVGGYWWTPAKDEYVPCQGAYGFQQDVYLTEIARQARYRPISNGEDQKFRKDCLAVARKWSMRARTYYPDIEHFHYIYRWGDTGSYHLSSSDTDTERRYRELGELPQPQGLCRLKPHWRTDYVKKHNELCQRHQSISK